jgi:membrane protein YdbS with pleckstrin-like domain
LDTRWVGLSRLVNAFAFSIVAAIILGVGTILLFTLPSGWNLLVPTIWLAAVIWTAIGVIWWPRWQHKRWSYRLGSRLLELRYGVIWQVSVAIPLSRLQHVDLHRGPLERRWGLASLEMHTAGTRDASHTVPGLDVATASTLRDQLITAANRGSHEQDLQ